jgi:predicted RNA binding protein YcfA (HicA-like mRNA interferase family)
MNSRALIRMLEQDGWRHVRTTGSHWHFRHAAKPGTVTVPHPKRDVAKGTLNSILKQAALKRLK